MDTDKMIEYAHAVQAYKTTQAEHAEAVADAHESVAESARNLMAVEIRLRNAIEDLGSDPMNVLKKQRVKVTDEDREVVLAALLRDSGTEADVARDAERSVEVTRLALRHLSRIGKATKDGRGASAVWSASTPAWSEQTAPSIADKVNASFSEAVVENAEVFKKLSDEGTLAEPLQNVDPVF